MPNSFIPHETAVQSDAACSSSDTARCVIGRDSLVPHVLQAQLYYYPRIQQSSVGDAIDCCHPRGLARTQKSRKEETVWLS